MPKTKTKLKTAIAVALAANGLNQRQLAEKLGIPDTTLSDWLRGVHPTPDGFIEQLELQLHLPPGSLPPAENAARQRGRARNSRAWRGGGSPA